MISQPFSGRVTRDSFARTVADSELDAMTELAALPSADGIQYGLNNGVQIGRACNRVG
jgi:hypothetical protein